MNKQTIKITRKNLNAILSLIIAIIITLVLLITQPIIRQVIGLTPDITLPKNITIIPPPNDVISLLNELNDSIQTPNDTLRDMITQEVIETLLKTNLTINDTNNLINYLNNSPVNKSIIDTLTYFINYATTNETGTPKINTSLINTIDLQRTYIPTQSSTIINDILSNIFNAVPCNGVTIRHYYGSNALALNGITGDVKSAYARDIDCFKGRNYTITIALYDTPLEIPTCLEANNQFMKDGSLYRNCVENDVIKAVRYNPTKTYNVIMNGFDTSSNSTYIGFTKTFLEQFP